jgi:RsiW-degrading membrane proteinase PrsW (M82 family)
MKPAWHSGFRTRYECGVLVYLIAMAIAPGLFLLHWSYTEDLREPEPVPNVFWYAGVGGIGVSLLAILIESTLQSVVGGTAFAIPIRSAWGFVPAMFLGVALVEESLKFGALVVLGVGDREIDEPFDWLVYAVAVGLGFATVENLAYVLRGGHEVAIVRAVTAVPVHAYCATTMGWWLAQASLTSCRSPRRAWLLALLEPTLWHGAYDTLVGVTVTNGLQTKLLVLFVSVQWAANVNRVTELQRLTAHAWPVPPIRYPLQFSTSLRRDRRPSRVPRDVGGGDAGTCCICHAPIRRVLWFSEDATRVRSTATLILPAHDACARGLPRCRAHGQRYLGRRCPRCRAGHAAHEQAS